MSIATKRMIASLLQAKEGVLRPSYMAVMHAYDLLGKGKPQNSHDVNMVIGSRIELTRVSISRLHKLGYLEWIETNLYRPTNQWLELKLSIEVQARKIRIS